MNQKSKIDRISKLTKEEKLKILDAIQEKKKRIKAKRPAYKPNAGQLEVHQCEKFERWVFSGNGAGKTAMATVEAVWAAKGYNPILDVYTKVPCRLIVVLDKPDKVEQKWLPELRKWTEIADENCHKRGKANITEITFPNGSNIRFLSHQMEELSFESIEADYIIFDEPPPRHIFYGLLRGLRDQHIEHRVLGVGTPIRQAWMRREIFEPWQKGDLPDIACFAFDSDVNKDNVDWERQLAYFARLTPQEQEVRRKGRFYDLEGLALSHLFSRVSHVIPKFPWDEECPCIVVADPHPSKAHYAVLMGVDRKNRLYVIDSYKEKAVARQFTTSLIDRGWFSDYKIIDIVYDSLGNSDTTSGEGFKSFGEVMNEVLEENELGRARATSFKEKSDEDFIDRIQTDLAIPQVPDEDGECIPRLRIFEGNEGVVTDVENVQWKKEKSIDENKDKLDLTHKDYLSCIKYGLATNLTFGKHKAKIYRRVRGAETYGVKKPTRPGVIYFRRRIIKK